MGALLEALWVLDLWDTARDLADPAADTVAVDGVGFTSRCGTGARGYERRFVRRVPMSWRDELGKVGFDESTLDMLVPSFALPAP